MRRRFGRASGPWRPSREGIPGGSAAAEVSASISIGGTPLAHFDRQDDPRVGVAAEPASSRGAKKTGNRRWLEAVGCAVGRVDSPVEEACCRDDGSSIAADLCERLSISAEFEARALAVERSASQDRELCLQTCGRDRPTVCVSSAQLLSFRQVSPECNQKSTCTCDRSAIWSSSVPVSESRPMPELPKGTVSRFQTRSVVHFQSCLWKK